MEVDSKRRNQRNRRRERAVRMQRQKQAAQGRGLGDAANGEEGDESPTRLKPHRPPNRRKKSKEPIFEEDLIDGFSILSFRSYEDLERTIRNINNNKTALSRDHMLFNCKSKSGKTKTKQKSEKAIKSIRNSPSQLNANQNELGATSDDNFRLRKEVNGSHPVTPILLSDVSNHSSSGSGYLCDSESGDDRGSDSSSDLFTTVKRELPPSLGNSSNILSDKIRVESLTSPLPNYPPFQNGPIKDEPVTSLSSEVVLSSSIGLPTNTVCASTQGLSCPPLQVTISGSRDSLTTCVSSAISAVSATSANNFSELRENCPPRLSPVNSGSLLNVNSISQTGSPIANNHSGGSKKNSVRFPPPNHTAKSLPLLAAHLSQTSPHNKNICATINGVKTGSISNSDLKGGPALPKTSVPASSLFPFSFPSSHISRELSPSIPSQQTTNTPHSLSSTSPSYSSLLSHSPSNFVVSRSTSSVSHSSLSNHNLGGRGLSPSLTPSNSHPKTPTLTVSRDSHSNSSLSSLSQLSHSQHSNNSKESAREGNSSRGNTPALGGNGPNSSNNTPCCTYATVTYGSSGLTSLVFTKSHCWGSSNTNPVLGSTNGPALTRTSGSSNSIPLPPSLHNSHHSSPFGSLSGHPTLHPAMFGPALHPAVSLPTSSSLGASAGPSPFVAGETMFPQPNPDFLRRELDTRFLVSHERTLGIHPPPLHQHQHQHNHLHHQHSSFLPPPHLGSPLVPPQPPTARLYDKFPKLEGPLYSRNTFGLPSYAGMSPILSGGASLFTPPAHIPGFQPKMNPLVKTKNMKSGRWCAMHIRIAWEIYHHQQQQSEVHKPGATGSASNKNPADPLRPPVHMLPHSVPRPHDFHMSLLLNAAGTTPGRTPFEGSSHPGTFLNPAAAHLSLPPFARPSYSGFGGPSNSFGGISSLGLGSSGVFTSRDSGLSNLSVASQDPWTHLHRNPLSIPTPLGSGVTSNPAPWGGLKAEAERERLHREDQERERKLDRKVDREREKEKQRKAELEKERREREISEKNKAIDRERKENERQKEREREIRTFHQINSTETPPNGEIVERNRNKERDLENSRDRRDRGNSRSPVRHGREVNMDSALDNTSFLIKQESRLKEQNPQEGTPNALATTSLAGISERDRIRTLEAHHSERGGNYMMKSVGPTTIKPVDHARLLEGIAVVPDGSSSERMTATLISPPVCSTITNTIASTRSRRDLYKPFDFTIPRNLDREQFFQRYAALNSVMFHERFREPEFSRQFSASSSGYNFFREGDHSLLYEREKHSVDRTKLIPPPPLRSTDTHFPSSIGLSGKCHPSSVGFPNSGMTKNGSPANFVSAVPPPLIPCSTGPSDCSSLPNPSHVVQRSNRGSPPLVSSKLGQNSVAHLENSHDPFFNKEKQNETLHPTEVSSLPR